nr:RecName: Full=Unknown protein from spot 107 of 2D-PAGE of thylakoid [Pisum sativum]
ATQRLPPLSTEPNR